MQFSTEHERRTRFGAGAAPPSFINDCAFRVFEVIISIASSESSDIFHLPGAGVLLLFGIVQDDVFYLAQYHLIHHHVAESLSETIETDRESAGR